ncbi:MAG TPA: DUF979 domain-containing protein [Gemmatimonadaceae bacterium]|nr:DUF979 domain-containing protein [Gemmatimonadaceae bacterium]
MITLEHVYWLMGLLAGGVAYVNARDPSNPKRWNNAAFWGLYAVTFLVGSRLPHVVSGVIVIAMVLVASIGKLGQTTRESQTPAQREASSARWGNRLFIPALTIPAVTLLGSVVLKTAHVGGVPIVDPKQVTQISLAIGALVGLAVGMAMLRPPASAPLHEARRLWDSVGWAAVLPQMLAALGALFATAGVGKVVASLAERWLPLGSPFAAVVTYTVGMALFTMIMGNAFAAFPVMTAGIGLPLIMTRFGGDVTVMAAVGMLSGFCGTLMTPMAANYNIVPAALLELPDEYAVIKAQIPTALILLVINTGIMYAFVYRR